MQRRMIPTLACGFQYLPGWLHRCTVAIAESRLSFTYRHSPSTLAIMALSRTLNDMLVRNVEVLQARESVSRTATGESLQDDQVELGSERASNNARTKANDL